MCYTSNFYLLTDIQRTLFILYTYSQQKLSVLLTFYIWENISVPFIHPSPSTYASISLSFHACLHPVHFTNCFAPRRVLIKMWLIYLVKTWTNKQKSSPNTQRCIKNRVQGDCEEVPIPPGSWDRSVWRYTWLSSIQAKVPLGEGPYTQGATYFRRGESTLQVWMPFHTPPPVILKLMMKLM